MSPNACFTVSSWMSSWQWRQLRSTINHPFYTTLCLPTTLTTAPRDGAPGFTSFTYKTILRSSPYLYICKPIDERSAFKFLSWISPWDRHDRHTRSDLLKHSRICIQWGLSDETCYIPLSSERVFVLTSTFYLEHSVTSRTAYVCSWTTSLHPALGVSEEEII